MGKTMNCPYCNNSDTLKVIYAFKGKHKGDNIIIKDGTIYRNEKPKYEKYDFDGERIKATLYNKYCPNCKTYFHTVSKMAVIDIDKVTFIYEINNNRYRYDFDFSNNNSAKYTCKCNYVLLDKDIVLSIEERLNMLKGIKNSEMKYWDKEYKDNNSNNYNWIIKLTYHNGLSECFFGYNKVSNNWNKFIDGFKDIIYKYDVNKLIDKII